jgi:hypothetical protein
MYFWVREKKLWTFAITCRKTAFNSYETTPAPSKGGEYSPPSYASSYSPLSEAFSYSPPLEGLGVVSEELKAVFVVVFFLLVYFLVIAKKHYTFSLTCMKTALDSSETTPAPSEGGEYSPPSYAFSYTSPT